MTYYELIISSIAKYLSVESVEYLIARKDTELYLISENFMRAKEIFIDGYELLENYKKRYSIVDFSHLPGEKLNNLTDIAVIFDGSLPLDALQLLQKLTDIFSFDIIFGYGDRQSPNWGNSSIF